VGSEDGFRKNLAGKLKPLDVEREIRDDLDYVYSIIL
jgi:hypothetical protein